MINGIIMTALGSLGVPVAFQKYLGTATTYITFFEYLAQGEAHADNTEKETGHYIQIDVWSKGDYTSLVDSTLTALKSAGFSRIKEVDMFDSEAQFYHRAIRVFYLENN